MASLRLTGAERGLRLGHPGTAAWLVWPGGPGTVWLPAWSHL